MMKMSKAAKFFAYISFAFAFCFLAIGYAAVQDTLTVSGSVSIEVQIKPFAVYGPIYDSNGDFVEYALNFYNRAAVAVGDEIPLGEGKQEVQNVYTGFDHSTYTYTDEFPPPWSENRADIVSVDFIDYGIQPKDMSYWFCGFTSCVDFDLAKLDTSEVVGDNTYTGGMDYVFYECSSVVTLDISTFDFSNVTSIAKMFQGCSSLKTIYAATDVDFTYMSMYDPEMTVFGGCDSLVGGNETPYNASNRDLTYARIDIPGRAGYFTEKPAA